MYFLSVAFQKMYFEEWIFKFKKLKIVKRFFSKKIICVSTASLFLLFILIYSLIYVDLVLFIRSLLWIGINQCLFKDDNYALFCIHSCTWFVGSWPISIWLLNCRCLLTDTLYLNSFDLFFCMSQVYLKMCFYMSIGCIMLF